MAPLGLATGFYGLGPTLQGDGSGRVFDPSHICRGAEFNWYPFGKYSKTTNGTGITAWKDASGNANHLVPTATNDADEQPALTSQGTVRFQQATDSLVFDSALSLGEFSICWKGKFRLGETVSNEFMIEGAADNIRFPDSDECVIDIGGDQRFNMPSGVDEATEYVFGAERDSYGDMMIYVNNVAGTSKASSSLNVATSTTIDLTQIGDPAEDSEFYEIVICGSALDASGRKRLYNYLNQISPY